MRVKNSAVLGDMVYEHIKEMILRKEIASGEKIPEKQIEEKLNVSRTPVREAVRRLSSDGLVQVYPNRYSEVATFDDAAIIELGTMRLSMDCFAAQLAVQNGSNRDFQELLNLAEECEKANQNEDLYSRIDYDCRFHMKLVEIGGNRLLLDCQNRLFLRTRLLQTTILMSTASAACDSEQHLAIVDALFKRDVEQVLKNIIDHLGAFYNINVSGFYCPVLQNASN